jgi:glycosyltransferase involved in cell wall biosynthesis
MTWAFLTGEYPPQRGGVGDYTRLVAWGLADAGEEVHVWAPATAGPPCDDPRVTVHRLPGHFGPQALMQLNADLDRLPSPRRVLVQYVPHAFGWKAMNIPFCLWLGSRRKDSIWSMFHEVAFPVDRNQRLSHNVLGAITSAMARLVARASEKIFYSTTAWLPLLERFASPATKSWLPVPSNLKETVDPLAIAAARSRLSKDSESAIVGHFGTYSPQSQELLMEVFGALLQSDEKTACLFAGRGSAPFHDYFVSRHPGVAHRVHAIETDCAQTLSANLAACDVMVQAYPDGVTTRRASLMASLALGKAIVTNCGNLTEPLWKESAAVALVPGWSPQTITVQVRELLLHEAERANLGARAAALYGDRFALRQTLKTLLSQT